MDDLQPEDDLKPDASDRRPSHSRKSSSVPKLAVSRQHVMIGVGVLVLLLLIFGIGSALKAPTPHEAAQQENSGARDISLGDTSSLAGAGNAPGAMSDASDNSGVSHSQQPQSVSAPPISSTPTQAQTLTPPAGQQRIELPGSMTDALSQQQESINNLAQGSTLPTAPATVAPSAKGNAKESTHPVASRSAPGQQNAGKTALPPKAAAAAGSKAAPTGGSQATTAKPNGAQGSVLSAPASHYTLQLSGASRPDTLKAFAKQQKLEHFSVYETRRDGQPWFVLVSGSYASSAEAKKAITSLPAEVQAKKPWVRPIRQVQQDLKK